MLPPLLYNAYGHFGFSSSNCNMALQMTVPFLSSFLPNPRHKLTAHVFIPQKCLSKHISCSTTTPTYSTIVPRRSRNYKPSIWDYDFVQSLVSDYKVRINILTCMIWHWALFYCVFRHTGKAQHKPGFLPTIEWDMP